MKTIVVSTDLSPAGNNAVKFAAHYAAEISCNLVVFLSPGMPPFKPTIEEAEFLEIRKEGEAAQLKNLDELVNHIYEQEGLKRNNETVRVAVKIKAFAGDAIMEAASEHHADLIIVGTHGATGLKMLGSITNEIIFKAEIPVLAIPPQCEYRKIETVVYATDFKNTVNELKTIVPFASRMKAVIEVFNLDVGDGEAMTQLDEKRLMKEVKYDKIRVVIQKEMKRKTMLEQLEWYMENRKPGILVMFPEERSVFDKVFVRSKTEKLAYHAKLPLLTYLKSRVKK
jgi:nucleotide-binding universal stress UspA family protein